MPTAEEFLDELNSNVVFRNDRICVRAEGRTRGQTEMLLEQEPPFVFLQRVDLVLEGPCSSWVSVPDRFEAEAPWGRVNYTGPDKVLREKCSVLDLIFEDHPDAKVVLVYAGCCGTYTESFKRALEQLKPEIIWIFPQVSDFCDRPERPDNQASLAYSLKEAGIIGLQQ